MNVKSWLFWVCLAVVFVSQVLLFRANNAAGVAQADAHDAHQKLAILQSQIDDLQSSGVANMRQDNARLRAQNQALIQKLAKANNNLTLSEADNRKISGQLELARQALHMQQNDLQQMSLAQQQAQAQAAAATAAAAAAAANTPAYASPDDGRDTCIGNLKQIDLAKQEWALEKNKDAKDIPTAEDLAPYLKGNSMPACPSGGTYTIGAMDEAPTCSIAGHVLP